MLKAKACHRCRVLKPVGDFSRNRSRPDGLAHYCRPCKAEAAAKRYAERPDVVRKAARGWYEDNRDRKLAWAREYREANRPVLRADNRKRKAAARLTDPERIRDQQREWSAANRERLNANVRQRRAAAPEKHRAEVAAWRMANRAIATELGRRYKARKRDAPTVPFTFAELEAKVAYWAGKCWMCGDPYQAIDHVKPLAKGGGHLLANLRPACHPCNHRKRDRWPLT